MKLIVGLGNPGKEYMNTRHNIGFMVVDNIVNNANTNFSKTKFNGLYTEINYQNEKILILKPQNYINLSGEVIKRYLDYFKIPIENMLIIQDDLDMKVGKIKLVIDSSSGGHNGIKSIEEALGTKNYKRLKIGIANDKEVDTKDYVLDKLIGQDKESIDLAIKKVENIGYDFIELDFNLLMNKYNNK